MTRFSTGVAVFVIFFAGSAVTRADVHVTNKTSGTIQVQIDTGSKTELKYNEKAVFNGNKPEVELVVYSGGSKKASAKVKNNSKVIIENKNGVWSIRSE